MCNNNNNYYNNNKNPSPAAFSPFPLMISLLPLSSVFVVNVRAVIVTQPDVISVSDITAEADREPGAWMKGKGCAATSRSQGEKGSLLSKRPPGCWTAYKHAGLFLLIYPISPSLQGVALF